MVHGARLDLDSDPVTCPLPQVVFGPVGTGTPTWLPEDQIPRELPPEQQQVRRSVPRSPIVSDPGIQSSSTSLDEAGSRRAEWCPPPLQGRLHPSPLAVPAALVSSGASTGRKVSNKEPPPPRLSYAAPMSVAAVEDECVALSHGLEGVVSLMQMQTTLRAGTSPDFTSGSTSRRPLNWLDELSCWALEVWELPGSEHVDPWRLSRWMAGAKRRKCSCAVTLRLGCPRRRLTPRSGRQSCHGLPPSCELTVWQPRSSRLPRRCLVVYEPFGGLCAGLGDGPAQWLCSAPLFLFRYFQHRPAGGGHIGLQLLQARYSWLTTTHCRPGRPSSALPRGCPGRSRKPTWSSSPAVPQQWLVVGGWECQDLSPAGPCEGLEGARSSTLAPLMQILAALQRCQARLPVAYLVENTAMQFNFRSEHIRTEQFRIICEALGQPVCIDATRFDSYAHRLRNYWTNLCSSRQLQAAVSLGAAVRLAYRCRISSDPEHGQEAGAGAAH
jgi:hypothetical protein